MHRYLVNTIAPVLLQRQVWTDKVLWTGFIVFCAHSVPACFELLLQLPHEQLQSCLADQKMLDKGVRAKLLDFVTRQPENGNLPRAILLVLGVVK